MITTLRERFPQRQLVTWVIAAAVLALAFVLGRSASPFWLGLLAAGIGGGILLTQPVLGLPAVVLAALIVPVEIGTGTDVQLNVASLLVPTLLVVWLLNMVHRRQVRIVPSPVNAPLALFLAANLFSLLIGRATWDPLVPVSNNFLLVQLAQWAIFAFSAGAFWLAGNMIKDEATLQRLTWTFLGVGGALALAAAVIGAGTLVIGKLATVALIRAPFWVLLAALAGGQLLFNRRLSWVSRLFLIAVLAATLVCTFIQQQEGLSNWGGVAAVLGTLVWLRFPRLRWPVAMLVILLLMLGVLFPAVYQFAGGDKEWTLSGESRLILTRRVLEVTMRNPVTGLGPAAYRPYASLQPLVVARGRLWVGAVVSSHNNYVDLFSHGGLVGLALFGWFVWAVARLGLGLRRRYAVGFAAGYTNAVLAAGVGALVIMALADWILPFVYNIGFPGFQASVLVWLFMGGLLSLQAQSEKEPGSVRT